MDYLPITPSLNDFTEITSHSFSYFMNGLRILKVIKS